MRNIKLLPNMPRYRPASRDGFSLLELLIALTILAIALVPVAYFYSKSLQMVEQASIRTRAIMLAQERLTELRQMPYEQIRSNVTPSPSHIRLFNGTIDTAAADWYGYDFESPLPGAVHGVEEWAGMFNYPLPLDYNPYRPQTQGYNNAEGAQRNRPNNPIVGMRNSHVNFNGAATGVGIGPEIDYEYEPIGFYTTKVYGHNLSLFTSDRSDVRQMDRRTITVVEPMMDIDAGTFTGYDHFRSGEKYQVDNYEIYGRRTIILDVLPTPQDTDTDNFAPDDDRDGNASALNPYPAGKGPDNKFQVLSRHGTRGKMVIVQVFWLPRDADNGYIQWDEMNKVELKTFIAATNEDSSMDSNSGGLTRNDYLIISPPT